MGSEVYTRGYSCPECDVEQDELPDVYVIEDGKFSGQTRGHSDMSTHICPNCDEESWRQGWIDGLQIGFDDYETEWIAGRVQDNLHKCRVGDCDFESYEKSEFLNHYEDNHD